MQIVIDMPEDAYNYIKANGARIPYYKLSDAIKKGTPLKTGHWIKEESIQGWDGKSYQCSACGRSIHLDTIIEDLEDYPYCHCGATMAESEGKEC